MWSPSEKLGPTGVTGMGLECAWYVLQGRRQTGICVDIGNIGVTTEQGARLPVKWKYVPTLHYTHTPIRAYMYIYVCVCVCVYIYIWGTRWRTWLRHCATSRKVAGSIPEGVIGIFHWHNPSGRTMTLGSTLIEMSTRSISLGVKAGGA